MLRDDYIPFGQLELFSYEETFGLEIAPLVPLACGIHYSANPEREGKPCWKCKHEAELKRKFPNSFQAGGTPYSALITD